MYRPGGRVLVTGGAGFIGANLVRRLLEDGFPVTILDNFSTGDRSHVEGLDVPTLEADVRDVSALEAGLDGAAVVVHLAASGSVVGSVEDPAGNFDTNVVGTFRLLEVARRAGVARLVLASSGGALFGDTPPPVNELSVPAPISPYGASKLAAEGYTRAFAHAYGLHAVVLRFANVYGPWAERKAGAVTAFLSAIRDGRPITVYGDGTASRDYVYVDDVTSALGLAVHRDVPPGSVLHVASGRETTLRELVEMCRSVTARLDHPVRYLPARRGEVVRNFASSGAARRLLGFETTVDLEDGLRRTWAWMGGGPGGPRLAGTTARIGEKRGRL